jgi:hypothetical protein
MKKLRTLDHPNVLKVLDILNKPDAFGLVTEPLPGEDVARLVGHGAAAFSEAEVVRILRELAAGVQHAQQRRVVFDNLKPSNVLLTEKGSVKIGALPRPPFEFVDFSDAAAYLGNLAYCAPELLRCEPPDERTAVYGLGITAYEMIISRVPQQLTGNLDADLEAVASQELPAPAELVEGLSPGLNAVIRRCLHKDRARRYASAAEVLNDLDGIQAKNAPLISDRRLLEVVTAVFPAPLAALARSLEREDSLLARKDKLLNQATGLIGYLGFLSAASLGTPLTKEFRRPALGHWVALARRALGGRGTGWPLSEWRDSVSDTARLLKALDEAVTLRNDLAHAAAPEEGAALHDWVGRMSACVRRLYRNLLRLARYALVAVEDLDYDEGQFLLGIRRLEGARGDEPTIRVPRPEPCTKGRVYFTPGDFSRMLALDPWVVLARCPLCFQRELFFYVSMDGGVVRYVTPDRGHGWSCPAPRGFERVFRD